MLPQNVKFCGFDEDLIQLEEIDFFLNGTPAPPTAD